MINPPVVTPDCKAKAERILADLDELAPLPQVVTKAMDLIHDSNSSTKDLARVLSMDQALVAKMLSMANSAYYGMPRRVVTIAEAIVRLGYNAVKGLLITASVAGMLQKRVPGYSLEHGELWRHSISTAIAARLIAQRTGFGRAEEVYIVGLLHDVGKIVLDQVLREDFARVIDRVARGTEPFNAVEQEVLGFDHAYIGGLVAQKWRLPAHFTEAIACHHRPTEASDEREITAMVHLADVVTLMLGIGVGGDGLFYPADQEAVGILRLGAPDVERLMADLAQFMADAQMFLMLEDSGKRR